MEKLEIKKISKSYGNTQVLKNISFSVKNNEFIGIMGSSGSGKTTLLNCISTIDTPTSGEVIFLGKDLVTLNNAEITSFRKRNLGFIFQDYNLLDTLTIKENISLALTINNVSPKDIEKRVSDIAIEFGIIDILTKYPYQVSGGQKQRCACARAIVTGPQLIFADEPTGALDSHASKKLMETMENMISKFSATILMVTHDPLIASYAKRILFLKDGEIYYELIKINNNRECFYNQIIHVISSMGGNEGCM